MNDSGICTVTSSRIHAVLLIYAGTKRRWSIHRAAKEFGTAAFGDGSRARPMDTPFFYPAEALTPYITDRCRAVEVFADRLMISKICAVHPLPRFRWLVDHRTDRLINGGYDQVAGRAAYYGVVMPAAQDCSVSSAIRKLWEATPESRPPLFIPVWLVVACANSGGVRLGNLQDGADPARRVSGTFCDRVRCHGTRA